MDFLGIGPLELLFIFIIVLIVLGPRDMVKTGQVIGRNLRRLMSSPTWRLIQDTSREIRHLPNRLARQAGLDELEQNMRETMDAQDIKDLKEQFGRDLKFDAWTQPTIGKPGGQANDGPDGTVSEEETPPAAESDEAVSGEAQDKPSTKDIEGAVGSEESKPPPDPA